MSISRQALSWGPFLLTALVAAGADARPINPQALNAGYGRSVGDENRAVQSSTRDANNNRVIVNGLMASPSGLASGLSGGLSGELDPFGRGVGTDVTASAIANQITIIAAGSWNTIVVEAQQINTGLVQATASANTGTVTNANQ